MTIEDPHLGKREIGDKPSDLIKDQLRLLEHFKNDGRKPSRELLDDIAVYKYILNSANPDKMAGQYMTESVRLRDEEKTFSISKKRVAINLGWKIY